MSSCPLQQPKDKWKPNNKPKNCWHFTKSFKKPVSSFLAKASEERIAQAKKQAQELLAFHKELEETTEQFLSATAKTRIAQAEKQAQELRQFRQDLFVSIFGISIN